MSSQRFFFFFFFSNTEVVRFPRQIPDDKRKILSGYMLFFRGKEEPLDQWESKVLRDAMAPKVLR